MSTLIKFLLTIQFFYKLLFREDWSNPFKSLHPDTGKKLKVLANGPSLKQFMNEELSCGVRENCEYFGMNSVSTSDAFTVLKPAHYVVSDSIFFHDTAHGKQRGLSSMQALAEKVDWEMTLYIPWRYRKMEYVKIVEQNPHIRIIHFHSRRYEGLDSIRNWVFRAGLGNGEYSTVLLNALYVAITLGYKDIELYGADHSFFNNLFVTDNNILCYRYEHFDSQETEVKPMIWHHSPDRDYFNMTLFLEEKYTVFRGHEIMASYAEYMGAHILNCTPGSLLDVYDRKASGEEEVVGDSFKARF